MPKKKKTEEQPDRPARGSGELKTSEPGFCPFRGGEDPICSMGCALFTKDAPDDITRSEMAHEGLAYTGRCSLRVGAEALAAMARKGNSLAGF